MLHDKGMIAVTEYSPVPRKIAARPTDRGLVARERRLAKRECTKGYEFRKEQCLLITGAYDSVKVEAAV